MHDHEEPLTNAEQEKAFADGFQAGWDGWPDEPADPQNVDSAMIFYQGHQRGSAARNEQDRGLRPKLLGPAWQCRIANAIMKDHPASLEERQEKQTQEAKNELMRQLRQS